MKYMGSKNRLAKELLPIILKDRKSDQWYVEPFCGGCGMFDKVDNPRMGNDSHYYLISLLKVLQRGWEPPLEITEEDYKLAQHYKDSLPPELVGYIGFQLSYGGKWFGGYRRDKEGKRNYSLEAYKNTIKQAPLLKDAVFYQGSYLDLEIPRNSIIYADPPYAGTTQYNDKFNHDIFWEWCRIMKEAGHQVFISEYTAPNDFTCVWSKEVYNTLDKNTGGKIGIERLFIP
jgi:DNA adenine methylase